MRYKQMAEQIIVDIEEGRLTMGSRLPSLRHMTHLYPVSMTTVLNCYRYLEDLGWLEARPQSGFYVTQPLLSMPRPSHPLFESRLSAPQLPSAEDVPSGPFGVSHLGLPLLPVAAMQRSLKRAIRHQGQSLYLYPDRQGEPSLRQALANHFATYGFPFQPEELAITNGCIDAVRCALETTTREGDAVAISSPCFSGLLTLLAGLKRNVVEIPCTEEGVDLDQLEHHMRIGSVQAGLFSTSFMNPQGTSLSIAQKQRLANMANQYRIPIIEDDIYMELSHQQVTPLPAKHWDKNGYLLWCGSVSKTLSAGLRIGWCWPGRYREAFVQMQGSRQFGISALTQSGLADFIGTGQYRTHLIKTRTALRQQMTDYQQQLMTALGKQVAISQPTGGMVLWFQVPGLNSAELVQRARSVGIDIRSGVDFTTLNLYQDCLRINAGWPLNSTTEDGTSVFDSLQQLVTLIQQSLSKSKKTRVH